MNVFLWILQVVLAGAFAMAGAMKVSRPKEKLVGMLPRVEDFSPGTVRFIGIAELAAAIGLILPAATGIAPVLTPLAATGIVVLMVLASTTHLRRKEPSAIAINSVLLVLAAVVPGAGSALTPSRSDPRPSLAARIHRSSEAPGRVRASTNRASCRAGAQPRWSTSSP